MSKAIKISLAVIILITLSQTACGKIEAAETETVYYITTANLNVRQGQGKEHRILFTLPKGTEVKLVSRKGDWYQIKYRGKKGYAFSKYLKYNRTDAAGATTSQTLQNKALYIAIGILSLAILLLGLFIYKKVKDRKLLKTVTKFNRGTKSERDLVFKLLKNKIPPETIFHDLYLRKNNGDYSQTDLVVVADVGVIVVEVKDYSGWIYGNGNHSQWTKVLAYGKQKYRFYNPIIQNNSHIKVLKNQIKQLKYIPIFSVIVFYGDCELKEISFVPEGTYIVKSNRVQEVLRIIMSNRSVRYENKDEVIRVLQEAVRNGDEVEIQKQHIESIEDMLGRHRVFD